MSPEIKESPAARSFLHSVVSHQGHVSPLPGTTPSAAASRQVPVPYP